MRSDPDKLTRRHRELVHSDGRKVLSHRQREAGDWLINTLMIEGCNTPFRYKRQQRYKSLEGARVNLTYYPDSESVGGIDMEVMTVVRIRLA